MTIKQAARELGLSERGLRNALPGDEDVATLEDQLLQVEEEIGERECGVNNPGGMSLEDLLFKKQGIQARLDAAYEEMQDENQEDRT